MAGLASINIKFTADLKQFSTKMQSANRSLKKMGKQMQNIGAGLSVGVTAPIVGVGFAALQTASNFEQLEARLKTAFQGSEEAATKAFKTIIDFTSNTPFQVEEVADAFIKLKNLGLEPSESALTSYGNTAAAMGKSLNQLIEAVADASTGEFERLKEFGIKSKSQGDQVSFTFQGVTQTVGKNAAEITSYLQNLGNVNFAGAMDAQTKTFQGRLSNLKDTLSLVSNEFGKILIEYIKPFIDTLRQGVAVFQDLSPETKKWIVILAGVAAAVGPLLALAGTILPAILTGFTILAGPIGIIIAALTAVGVIIYKNWQPIKAQLVQLANYFIDLYNESTAFRVAVEYVVFTFKNMWSVAKFALNAIWTLLKGLSSAFVNNFKLIGSIIKAVFTGNFGAISGIVKDFQKTTVVSFSDTVKNLGKDWGGLMDDVSKNTSDAMDNITKKSKIKLLPENVDVSAVTEKIKKVVSGGGAKGNKKQGLANAGLKQVGPSLDIANPLQQEAEQVDGALNGMTKSFIDFSAQSSQIITQAANNALAGFGVMIAGLASGNLTLGDVAGGLLSIIGDMATQLGKAAIEIGIGMLAIKTAFTNPFTAIAAGVALVAIGALISSAAQTTSGGGNYAGAFANGGIVGGNSFSGDKLFARVNSGEMILNQKQQSGLAGLINPVAQAVEVVLQPSIDFSGDKFKIMLDKVNKTRSRRV